MTVTQPGRIAELARAIACFRSQTLKQSELVIVHDGGVTFHQDVQALIASESGEERFQVHQVAPGRTLGELRNFTVELAKYPIICQWDDDDLYHPRRLEMQFAYLKIKGADFCFLTDQLHLFEAERMLYWEDWNAESYPMSLIQGTLMGEKRLLGQYPTLRRGEDTRVLLDLVQRGCKIAALGGKGWIYIYTYCGKNVWNREHHAAISDWKRLSAERLKSKVALLEARLCEYRVAFGRINVSLGDQLLELNIGTQIEDDSHERSS